MVTFNSHMKWNLIIAVLQSWRVVPPLLQTQQGATICLFFIIKCLIASETEVDIKVA